MKNYRLIFEENFSLVSSESHIQQYILHRNIFGSTHNNIFHYSQNGSARELHLDIDNQKWHRLGKKLLNEKFFAQLLNQGKILRSDFAKFIEIINNPNLGKISDEELLDLFIKSGDFFSKFRGYFKTSRPEFQAAAEAQIKKLLSKKIEDLNQIQKYFEVLSSPHKYDEINQEFVDWVKIVSKRSSTKQLGTLIIKHIYNFPWLVGQSYDKNQIKQFFRKKYFQDRKRILSLKIDIAKLTKDKNLLKSEQIAIYKKFKSHELKYLSYLFQQSAMERMRLKGGWWGANLLFFPLYGQISKRTNIPLADLYSFYRINEVIAAIKAHRPIVSSQELKRRQSAYLLWLKNGKLLFVSGKKAQEIIDKELKDTYKKNQNQEVKGKIANSGFALGRVKIVMPGDLVMLSHAIKTFKKGDIMVTSMTQPNMVPLMKKAAAIVTDEGGMISHAAIMAREFGVPCVVGTEIATKIFKIGDLVEVDASKGIVKLVKPTAS